MIGDALSDAYESLSKQVLEHYGDELNGMPRELRLRVIGLLSDLDATREAVDRFQFGTAKPSSTGRRT